MECERRVSRGSDCVLLRRICTLIKSHHFKMRRTSNFASPLVIATTDEEVVNR